MDRYCGGLGPGMFVNFYGCGVFQSNQVGVSRLCRPRTIKVEPKSRIKHVSTPPSTSVKLELKIDEINLSSPWKMRIRSPSPERIRAPFSTTRRSLLQEG